MYPDSINLPLSFEYKSAIALAPFSTSANCSAVSVACISGIQSLISLYVPSALTTSATWAALILSSREMSGFSSHFLGSTGLGKSLLGILGVPSGFTSIFSQCLACTYLLICHCINGFTSSLTTGTPLRTVFVPSFGRISIFINRSYLFAP